MNDDATMNRYAGKYEGMDRYACAQGAGRRSGGARATFFLSSRIRTTSAPATAATTTVEPMTSDQWFVKMKPLAEPALEAVRSGDVKFCPRPLLQNLHQLDGEHATTGAFRVSFGGDTASPPSTATTAER